MVRYRSGLPCVINEPTAVTSTAAPERCRSVRVAETTQGTKRTRCSGITSRTRSHKEEEAFQSGSAAMALLSQRAARPGRHHEEKQTRKVGPDPRRQLQRAASASAGQSRPPSLSCGTRSEPCAVYIVLAALIVRAISAGSR